MANKNYTIKTMSREQLDIAIDWAGKEGWNPGCYDADCYYAADPNGFLIGLLDDVPIATISVIKYGENFGFLGFYIVKPEYRGKGYGIKLWNAGLNYLAGRNIGLDGVLAQQENYQKSGFELAYRNIRYQGLGGGDLPQNTELIPLSNLPFESIDGYARSFHPTSRTRFNKLWIEQPESHAYGVMQNGKLAGYGVIRKCQGGYKIAPLFADNAELAETLFLTLRSKTNVNDHIFLDTPEVNTQAVTLANKYQMVASFETARMYTGDAPAIDLDRLYGVTSFEIG